MSGRRSVRRRKHHADVITVASDELILPIHSGDAEFICSRHERHGDSPTSEGSPLHWIRSTVDPNRSDVHRCAAGNKRKVVADRHAGIHGETIRVHSRKLHRDAALRLRQPRLNVHGGIFHVHAVRSECVEFRFDERPAVGDVQWAVDEFAERTPIHPQKRWRVVDRVQGRIRTVPIK